MTAFRLERKPPFTEKCMEFENITLIGMPGSGKSTIGKPLAKQLGFSFEDTDQTIEKATGKKLCDIISEIGEQGFLALENQILSDYNNSKRVISTGGSAVFGKEAMENLRRRSKIVYLKVDPCELAKRLGDLRARGVILCGCSGVAEIYEQRKALYEQYADIILECKGSEEDCARQLMEKLQA